MYSTYPKFEVAFFLYLFQNQNISYIRNATNAEFSIKPFYSGISDGLTITLKHNTLEGVNNAKRLLLSLLDTVSTKCLPT